MLKNATLMKKARAGDTKIYVEKARFGNSECIIKENNVSEIIKVGKKGKDSNGNYAELESKLQNDFTVNAEIKLTDRELIKEIKQSKEILLNLGLDISNFTYPFNLYDQKSKEIVSKYYDSARASGNMGINEIPLLDRYCLNARNFLYLSDEQICNVLDQTVSKETLCIFYTHTWEKLFTPERLTFLIEQAKARNIDIVTRKQAFSRIST